MFAGMLTGCSVQKVKEENEVGSSENSGRELASFAPGKSMLQSQEKYEMTCEGIKNKKLNLKAEVSLFNNDIQIRNILLQGILEYVGKKKGEFPTSGLVGQVLDDKTEKEIYIFSFGHEEFELRLPAAFVDLKSQKAEKKVSALLTSGNDWDQVFSTFDLSCQLARMKKTP